MSLICNLELSRYDFKCFPLILFGFIPDKKYIKVKKVEEKATQADTKKMKGQGLLIFFTVIRRLRGHNSTY